MKLDYIDNLNTHGDNMVRLYDFDMSEAGKLSQAIMDTVILNKKQLNLNKTGFIQGRNCQLTLCLSKEDAGITTTDNLHFFCELTLEGYEQMLEYMAPFCTKETKGHRYLYDIDSPTDFLFSPKGTW